MLIVVGTLVLTWLVFLPVLGLLILENRHQVERESTAAETPTEGA
ncbi:hypothetical protein [Halalkalicoccus salilacus]